MQQLERTFDRIGLELISSARSVCCDTRTIRLGASPRKPDTSPGTLGRNSNLALALLAPAQLAHLGFGAFGSGGRFLGGKAAIASTTVASVTRKGDKIGYFPLKYVSA